MNTMNTPPLLVLVLLALLPITALADPPVNLDFQAGLDSWTLLESGGGAAPGAVEPEAEGARILEGDSFRVGLSQTFDLPPAINRARIPLDLAAGLESTAAGLPDAFEVAVLDPATSLPLLAGWAPHAISAFNVEEGGETHTSEHALWDGQVLELDLAGLAAGQTLRLALWIVGGDTDTGSSVGVGPIELAWVSDQAGDHGPPDGAETPVAEGVVEPPPVTPELDWPEVVGPEGPGSEATLDSRGGAIASDGCGCRVHGQPPRPSGLPGGAVALLLLLLNVVFHRRAVGRLVGNGSPGSSGAATGEPRSPFRYATRSLITIPSLRGRASRAPPPPGAPRRARRLR